MLTRQPIAPQGPEFSRLVYGTWRILNDGTTSEAINQRLQRCVELGITTIDTAEIYGKYEVESALGQALALTPRLREQLQIVTKAGIYVPNKYRPHRRTPFYDASAEQLVLSVEKSLRLLGTDHVDLFLVHRPDWLTSAEDTATGLNRLIRAGKIKSAGVSNYNVHQFDLLNSFLEQPLVTNQIEFHLLHMDPIYDGVLDQCQKHHIQPMAWSPLAGGKLFDPKNEAAQRIAKVAAELSAKYEQASVEQLAYAWIMAHPSRPLPVIGTNKLERIESAAKLVSVTLDREDWYALWTAAQGRNIP